jgi:hypothetical protein
MTESVMSLPAVSLLAGQVFPCQAIEVDLVGKFRAPLTGAQAQLSSAPITIAPATSCQEGAEF